MKDNTYCLAQRVKAAVMLQPSLLERILNNKSTNVKIVESSIRRLLPYRTSVEIEFIGNRKNIISKYLVSLYNKDNNIITRHIIKEDVGNLPELTSSIVEPIIDLPILYKILDGCKKVGKVDKSGSIHIHVDISQWLTNSDIKIRHKRLIGLYNLFFSGTSKEIRDYNEEILNKIQIISNIKSSIKYTDTGRPITNDNIAYNNRILGLQRGTERTEDSYCTYNRRYFGLISLDALSFGRENSTIQKRCWVNLRMDIQFSIEIRTFKCSLDYEEILQFMIDSNKIVKRILQISEYLGNKANTIHCDVLS